MSKILKELQKATGEKGMGEAENRETYLHRVFLAATDVPDAAWEELSQPAQKWVNGNAEAYQKLKGNAAALAAFAPAEPPDVGAGMEKREKVTAAVTIATAPKPVKTVPAAAVAVADDDDDGDEGEGGEAEDSDVDEVEESAEEDESAETGEAETASADETEEAEAPAAATPEPKKRGRPRKETTAVSGPAPEKRRPGRPRKETVEAVVSPEAAKRESALKRTRGGNGAGTTAEGVKRGGTGVFRRFAVMNPDATREELIDMVRDAGYDITKGSSQIFYDFTRIYRKLFDEAGLLRDKPAKVGAE